MNGADSISPTVPPSCAGPTPEFEKKKGKEKHTQLGFCAYLDDAHVWFLAGIIDWDFGYSLYPILDGIRDVRDNLRGVARESQRKFLPTKKFGDTCTVFPRYSPFRYTRSVVKKKKKKKKKEGEFRKWAYERTSFSITSR
jgi:hypothetical protein